MKLIAQATFAVSVLLLAACGSAPASVSPAASVPASTQAAASNLAPAASAPAVTSKPASSSQPSSGVAKVNFAYSNLTAALMWLGIAQQSGIFQKNGLDVNASLIAGGANTSAALVAGELDVANVGGSEILSAAAGGAPVIMTAMTTPYYPFLLEVTADVKSPADLKGKKLGAITRGGSIDVALREWLPTVGLTPDNDVTILQMGSTQNLVPAMVNGSIQGTLSSPPDTLKLEANGFHSIADFSSIAAATAGNVVAEAWLAGHHDVMQRFVDSYVEAVVVQKKDKAQAEKVMQQMLKLDDVGMLDAAYDYYAAHTPTLPFVKPEQFKSAINALGPQNPKVRDVDLNSIIDPSFVQSAA